jgi:hypothetical protein
MEEELGSEIVRTFGVRLKRIYGLDNAALPPQVEETLERLKQAEADLVARRQQEPRYP